jgi:tetratricopeptide (TPR) repeat protein
MEEQFVPETEEAPEGDATELTLNDSLHVGDAAVEGNADSQLPGALEDDPRSDPREALTRYKMPCARTPASARHIAELAEGYAAADLPHQALKQYQRALETQRESGEEEMPDAHLGIGDICRTFAMSAVAVRSYERAVRLRPKRPFYRWKLASPWPRWGYMTRPKRNCSKQLNSRRTTLITASNWPMCIC